MSNSIEKTGRIYDYVAVGILVVGLALIFFIPHWFVQPARIGKFDLTETGNIGATIGGITAPIVGFVTALLMYIAFKVQYIANSKQWSAFNLEIKQKNIESISYETQSVIDSIKFDHVQRLEGFVEKGVKKPDERRAATTHGLDITKKLILYIDNYLFLFNRLHSISLDDEIKEHYRLRLLRFDSYFKNYLSELNEHLSEYDKRQLFTDPLAEELNNIIYLKQLSLRLPAYVQNVEYLRKYPYIT